MKAYQNFTSSKSIIFQLSDVAENQATQRALQVKRNRGIIGRLFSVVRLLGKLGMPFRGHMEDQNSLNKGLFRELIEFIAKSGDEILNDHLQHMPGNATYLSPTIQNEMIDIVGNSILEIIAQRVKLSGYYSVLMDETTDARHIEQVSIMVRYVDIDAKDELNVVNERLLGVVSADETTGEALTKLLLGVLTKNGLNVENIIGQGYDGGANMRGGSKGVQARIRELNPRAMYTHCFAHCLNRALVNAVCSKEHAVARNFFGIVELIYTFIEGSAARHNFFISVQERLNSGTTKPALHMKGLSDTRWNCRADTLKRIIQPEVYQAVIETVDHVADTTSDGSVRGVAAGLKKSLTDFQFVVQLFTMQPVFEQINETSVLLQSPQLDLLKANTHIESLASELSDLRTENAWNSALRDAVEFSENQEIKADFPETRTRKVPRRLLNNPNVAADIMDIGADKGAERRMQMRADYFALLDRLNSEIIERFPKTLKNFAPLQTQNMDMIDAESSLAKIAEIYDLDVIRLKAQWRLFRRSCGRNYTPIAASYLQVPREHDALRKAYQILLTLPVTSAGVERSFSKLALIKSKLRTTMTQTRLQSLLFCAVEKDILNLLSTDTLVAKFAAAGDRRLDLG